MTCRILALDTATEACSAALHWDGEIRSECFEIAPRQHTALILPQLETVLQQAGCTLNQLDALAFGRGPGAFTGLRLAASVVQGLALAADLPVVPISNLAALVLGAQDKMQDKTQQNLFAVAIDARMDEVYWGCYGIEAGLPQLLDSERVVSPDSVALPKAYNGQWIGVGTGFGTYGQRLESQVSISQSFPADLPRAACIARLAARQFVEHGGVAAAEALPVYLRDQVAKKPSNKAK